MPASTRRQARPRRGPWGASQPKERLMTISRRIRLAGAAAVVPLAALSLAACGGSSSTGSASGTDPTTTSGKPATLGVASSGGLGKILVNSQGRTLYLFQKDAGARSACSGACAASWPPDE